MERNSAQEYELQEDLINGRKVSKDVEANAASSTKKDSLWPQVLASIAAASFHLPIGIVIGYSAILIPQLESPTSEIPVTTEETSWIASLAVIVVPFGAFLTGYLVDTLGRLNTIRLASLPYIIGWLLIATATNLNMILAGRFLTGFAMAMGPSPAIIYITEVARPDLRGSLISLGPSLTSFGMVLVYAKGALLNWRIIAWMGLAYCLPPLILMWFWSPESPTWLMTKGKDQKALKSICHLLKISTNEDDSKARQQLAELRKEYNTPDAVKIRNTPLLVKIVKGFSQPTGYKPLIILFMLFFFQQFSGIYITIFYAVTFFQEVGSGFDAYISTILIGVIRLVVGLLTTALLRRFGRRPLCIISGFGMAVALSMSGYYTWRIHSGDLSGGSIVPVVCILVYVCLAVAGLLTVPWTMSAEMFPIEVRGVAQALTVSLAHAIMFVALYLYRRLQPMLGAGPHAVHWFFASIALASCAFVYLFVPETHGKKLSEISDYFKDHTVYILRNRTRKNQVPQDEASTEEL